MNATQHYLKKKQRESRKKPQNIYILFTLWVVFVNEKMMIYVWILKMNDMNSPLSLDTKKLEDIITEFSLSNMHALIHILLLYKYCTWIYGQQCRYHDVLCFVVMACVGNNAKYVSSVTVHTHIKVINVFVSTFFL